MSKKRLGKRERMARKRRNSMRKQGHVTIMGTCAICSKRETWEFNPAKAKKLRIHTKLVCGQCRSSIRSCAGVPAVGT